LAAHRGGIRTFLLPKKNAKDMAELPDVVKNDVELIQVGTLDDVLEVALLPAEKTRKPRTPARDTRSQPAPLPAI